MTENIISLLSAMAVKGIFIYSIILFGSYLLIAIMAISEIRKHLYRTRFTNYEILASSIHAPSVSILAPAYNEEKSIVQNIRSLLSIFYANLEVIIINDGSTDNSMEEMILAYDLEPTDLFVSYTIPCNQIKTIYRSRNALYHKLIVIDKVNGGKADALNAGINISSNKYIVCIDADCVLEKDALLKMVKPFLEQQAGEQVIASGGVIRVANSCIIEDGKLVKINLPGGYLERMQLLEYIRAFILGRMAWSKLNGLLIISGAFGAFNKEIVIKCGGYYKATVGEDMELVVRMRRYMEEKKLKYRVTYIPDPLCWTEVPSNLKILGRQRNRWMRGTIDSLRFHRIMFLNPRYGLLGMISYPYWFFFEMCAPIVELGGFTYFLLMSLFGLTNWIFFFGYLLCVISLGYLYSAYAILMEVVTFNQYNRRVDVMKLLLTALLEPFYFHPFVVWSSVRGYVDYLRKKNHWGVMTREGFNVANEKNILTDKSISESPAVVPASEKPSDSAAGFRTILNYYLSHLAIFISISIATRAFELIFNISAHGIPNSLASVILYSMSSDLIFLAQFSFLMFPVFASFYLISRKFAHVFFVAFSTIMILLQLALIMYFATAFTPLGADLWGYSRSDIRQTIGATGVINIQSIIYFLILLSLILFVHIRFSEKIRINVKIRFAFLIVFITGGILSIFSIDDRWKPGQEYHFNLAANKSAFLVDQSLDYFFPSIARNWRNTDSYVGLIDSGIVRFSYVDEQKYPFLHNVDTAADVLSPFFNKSSVPPNVVILIIEGMGRAFTNRGAYLGNFTPFIDSLSAKSLYWENFLSTGGRTFAVMPSLMASLPFGRSGFTELGEDMPQHLSLMNLLAHNGYSTSFYGGFDASFDNINTFLRKNNVDQLIDEKGFSSNYLKLPTSRSGFSWGYGDKELYKRYFETKVSAGPSLDVILTVSTHSPFLINEQDYYLKRFEDRMDKLGFDEEKKSSYREYNYQYSSILYMDDAVQNFMKEFEKRPDFENTVFIITGDHRIPEIPMSTKLDRYHVPLLIYSPMLKRTAKFSSISTHFDVLPSLAAWLKNSFNLQMPSQVNWMGSGLDTARQFRNIHAYPLMQAKNTMIDFIMGDYVLNNNKLYKIDGNLGLDPVSESEHSDKLRAGFAKFKERNEVFIRTQKLTPDSILAKYTRPKKRLN